MEFSEKVVVLQVGKFKEADMWIRFLSPTRGLLSAFAFGGSRSRRRFVGCLDVFNEIHVRVASSHRTPYLALQEGVLIKGLSRLRRDWGRFGQAVNCARFVQSFGSGPEEAAQTHHIMRDTLALLEEAESVPPHLPLHFRVRLAFEQGYALDATCCNACGAAAEQEPLWLLLREGRVLCGHCIRMTQGHALPLGTEARSALHMIHTRDPSSWTSLSLSPRAASEYARAMDGFIQFHVGISWNNGRFVRH